MLADEFEASVRGGFMSRPRPEVAWTRVIATFLRNASMSSVDYPVHPLALNLSLAEFPTKPPFGDQLAQQTAAK